MYVISVNYKKAPLEIRSRFAFSKAEQEAFLDRCRQWPKMAHSVILSTCNRMELYTQFPEEEEAKKDTDSAQNRWDIMEEAVCRAKGIPLELCRKYGNRYCGEGALVHLHRVASGVDSMVMGEDEILGQVKDAYYRSMEAGCTDFALNTIFKSAITCAKKIKTDTSLSKTSVSVATLAAGRIHEFMRQNNLGSARVMIIGMTGSTGSTVMKNIRGRRGISIVGTSRRHNADGQVIHVEGASMVAYERRYEVMGSCDVIVSATGSPHYTLTYEKLAKNMLTSKPRVLVDLAVPIDIEEKVEWLPGVKRYDIDDFRELAKANNEKKQHEALAADQILEEARLDFERWMVFQQALPEIARLKEWMLEEAEKKGFEKAIDKMFYRLRDHSNPDDLRRFFEHLKEN